MIRGLFTALIVSFVGCASTEKIGPVTVPEDGTNTEYVEFLPRLRVLAWRATEAFYRDRWDELDESAVTLDKAVRVLKQSKNVPQRVLTDLNARCDDLATACVQLREAIKQKSAEATSERLQKIHVLIRELRSEP